jgi:methylated-DNA-[protein]-cysteine S-methyltransferase
MRGDVVLAHELRYAAPPPPSLTPRAPQQRAHAPRADTRAVEPSREGDRFVAISRDREHGDGIAAPAELVERFRVFLAGHDVGFDDVRLDLSWATPFQRRLTSVLRSVPRGEVVTYGELAALAGRPGAARAAGTYCATNRFAIVVPCHRVVAAGGIGGYGTDGIPVKRRLLALEGVLL